MTDNVVCVCVTGTACVRRRGRVPSSYKTWPPLLRVQVLLPSLSLLPGPSSTSRRDTGSPSPLRRRRTSHARLPNSDGPPQCPFCQPSHQPQPPASTALSQDNVGEPPHPPPPETVPRTTAWRKRQMEAGGTDQPRKAPRQFLCSKCGLPKRKDTGHTQFGGTHFCSVASGGKSVEVWLAEQRDATKGAK